MKREKEKREWGEEQEGGKRPKFAGADRSSIQNKYGEGYFILEDPGMSHVHNFLELRTAL